MANEIKTAPESMIYKLIELYARSKNIEVTNIQLIYRGDEPEKEKEAS